MPALQALYMLLLYTMSHQEGFVLSHKKADSKDLVDESEVRLWPRSRALKSKFNRWEAIGLVGWLVSFIHEGRAAAELPDISLLKEAARQAGFVPDLIPLTMQWQALMALLHCNEIENVKIE